jgi:ribose/xylose/arabinose/galactoside ABC-type transport system permease subunit
VLSVALLLILASVLIPSWDIARVNFLHMVAGNMAGFLLLPALGFLLCLRCGVIDLSVWATSGAGGVVAAVLILRGWPGPLAFAAGAATGLGIGLISALLVVLARLPSLLVTPAVAMGVIWVLNHFVPGRAVEIPEFTFGAYMDWHSSPALAIRVLSVAIVYLSVLLGLLMIDSAVWRGVVFSRGASVFAALAASGLLAGLGGALWLIDNSRAPLPTRLIDDLRIPAAAILAGGLFLGRKGRELLAGMSLPAAVLLATIWQQKAWVMTSPGLGLTPQLLVLMAMTIAVHLAFGQYVEARGSGRRVPTLSVLLTVAGIALVAGAANFRAFWVHDLFHLAGVVVWLAGMPAIIVSMRQEARLAQGQWGPAGKPKQEGGAAADRSSSGP